MAAQDTQQAILDAAETLLGEVGFAAMSLRELTRRAGVNLAGVNYHFGSKEDLARAVLSRRIAPVNAERHRRLDELERAARGRPVALADVVAAFLRPALELAAGGDRRPCAMLGRLIAEEPPFLRDYLTQQFGGVADRFARALTDAVPGLDFADASWRLHFMVGAMSHAMQRGRLIANVSNGLCGAEHMEQLTSQLESFCIAGIAGTARGRAPTGRRSARATTAARTEKQ